MSETSTSVFWAAAWLVLSACQSETRLDRAPAKETSPATTTQQAPAAQREASHSDAEGAWCGGHGVPEAFCTLCNPALIPVFQAKNDWCAEHKLPESVCPQCGHGMKPPTPAEAPVGEMCAEHGVPEAFCTKCNPSLIPVFKAKNDWCAEHELPESVCPQCGGGAPKSGSSDTGTDGTEIRFASDDVARQAGLGTARAAEAPSAGEVVAPCRILFDPARSARVNARASGVVMSLKAQVGDRVARGATLAVLRSAEVASERANRDAVRAHVDAAAAEMARVEALQAEGLGTVRDVQTARQELESARAEAAAAEARLAEFGAEHGSGAEYSLLSPVAGVVTLRAASVGEAVADETLLFEVVDPSRVWAEIAIPESDLFRIFEGQRATISIAGMGREYEGEIEGLAPMVDPATRTGSARIAIDNADGRLRANLFGVARIEVTAEAATVTVPRSAVQNVKGQSYVFVRTASDCFVARAIELAVEDDLTAWITSGLRAGEEVATTGSFLLKTEVMKESIGAGCCEVEVAERIPASKQ